MKSKVIIGIDEAGRGPLAGPLVVAAVAGIDAKDLRGIRDSKRLTKLGRERWYRFLRQKGLCRFASVSPHAIDCNGIVPSTRKAVGRLLSRLSKNYKQKTTNCSILLDGSLFAPKTYKNQRTVIRGDERIPIIAAASIIAKVTRDRKMMKMHIQYPLYGFERHKGYGTRAHFAAIRTHGLSDIHRRSFCTRIF
ncbi:MAG: ribonuclease HII [Candidatus Ryanbacteria bacterium]|nr:ribonuclease HII [Candidatus Ryanbacteria bacterium]